MKKLWALFIVTCLVFSCSQRPPRQNKFEIGDRVVIKLDGREGIVISQGFPNLGEWRVRYRWDTKDLIAPHIFKEDETAIVPYATGVFVAEELEKIECRP